MNIVEALKHGSVAEHQGGKASILTFKDMGFCLLTINNVTFVIQDLEKTGMMSMCGVYDQGQIRLTESLVSSDISFNHGWKPRFQRWRLTTRIQACLVGWKMTFAYLWHHLFRLSCN